MSAPGSVDLSVSADPGVPVRVLFNGHQDLVNSFQAVIMRREGGVLLALPDGPLDEESLAEHAELPADGSEPLAGPHVSFTVPLLTMRDSGSLEPAGESVSVMVVDMNVSLVYGLVLPYPEEGQEEDIVTLFRVADPKARPNFSDPLPKVKAWVDAEMFERTGFYSAQEEDVAPASPKATTKAKPSAPGSTVPAKAPVRAKSGPKKHTVASLAQQVELSMGSLPAITDQLAKLASQQEQRVLQETQDQADRAFQPAMGGEASMPISTMLTPGKKLDLSGLAKMMATTSSSGICRLSYAIGSEAGLGGGRATGSYMNPPEDMEQVKQSKALQALMMHVHASGSDPMSHGHHGESERKSEGSFSRKRFVFPESLSADPAAHGSHGKATFSAFRNFRRLVVGLPGEIRRIWPKSRTWYDHVVYRSRLRCHGRGRNGPCHGPFGPQGGYGRAGKLGCKQVEPGLVDPIAGRSTSKPMDQPGAICHWSAETFCSAKRPILEQGEAEILQGKRTELLGKGPTSSEDELAAKPQPKRRAGKGKGAQGQNQQADDVK